MFLGGFVSSVATSMGLALPVDTYRFDRWLGADWSTMNRNAVGAERLISAA